MGLTKEQAVEEHRKMWRWIAKELETHSVGELAGKYYGLPEMKKEYMNKFIEEHKINHFVLKCCFCCEYAAQENGDIQTRCIECPVVWPIEGEHLYQCDVNGGIYDSACKHYRQMIYCCNDLFGVCQYEAKNEHKEICMNLCKQIAELPEA